MEFKDVAKRTTISVNRRKVTFDLKGLDFDINIVKQSLRSYRWIIVRYSETADSIELSVTRNRVAAPNNWLWRVQTLLARLATDKGRTTKTTAKKPGDKKQRTPSGKQITKPIRKPATKRAVPPVAAKATRRQQAPTPARAAMKKIGMNRQVA